MRFKNQGLDSVEVQDNGSGIAPHNYESLALKHYTSKLSAYADLDTLQTFGFRGEALFSLCASSEKVTVTTSTGANGPMGAVLEFDRFGKLLSSDKKVARTVCSRVFEPQPTLMDVRFTAWNDCLRSQRVPQRRSPQEGCPGQYQTRDGQDPAPSVCLHACAMHSAEQRR